MGYVRLGQQRVLLGHHHGHFPDFLQRPHLRTQRSGRNRQRRGDVFWGRVHQYPTLQLRPRGQLHRGDHRLTPTQRDGGCVRQEVAADENLLLHRVVGLHVHALLRCGALGMEHAESVPRQHWILGQPRLLQCLPPRNRPARRTRQAERKRVCTGLRRQRVVAPSMPWFDHGRREPHDPVGVCFGGHLVGGMGPAGIPQIALKPLQQEGNQRALYPRFSRIAQRRQRTR